MNLKTILIVTLLFITSCKSQSALQTEAPLPTATATLAPTETSLPPQIQSDVFGAIPLNSVQAFSIEPVAKAIFDQTLHGYVTAGSILQYRVDRIAVFPSGNGTLLAEIFYSLQSNNQLWLEDGGVQSTDGWITGKCSRFDLIATETEHQLKNKRLCS